jgi:hypothetical protein
MAGLKCSQPWYSKPNAVLPNTNKYMWRFTIVTHSVVLVFEDKIEAHIGANCERESHIILELHNQLICDASAGDLPANGISKGNAIGWKFIICSNHKSMPHDNWPKIG